MQELLPDYIQLLRCHKMKYYSGRKEIIENMQCKIACYNAVEMYRGC